MEESEGYIEGDWIQTIPAQPRVAQPPAPQALPAPEPKPVIRKFGFGPAALGETPDDISFNEQQTAAIIEAVSEITDVDPLIIERCQFKAKELTRLFKKAIAYHNELAEMHGRLQSISTDNNQYMPGSSGRHVNFKSITTDALKLTTTIELCDKRIQRLADSLIARAGMKHG